MAQYFFRDLSKSRFLITFGEFTGCIERYFADSMKWAFKATKGRGFRKYGVNPSVHEAFEVTVYTTKVVGINCETPAVETFKGFLASFMAQPGTYLEKVVLYHPEERLFQKYVVLDAAMRARMKELFQPYLVTESKPTEHHDYLLKLRPDPEIDECEVTVNAWNNGTLAIQGEASDLFFLVKEKFETFKLGNEWERAAGYVAKDQKHYDELVSADKAWGEQIQKTKEFLEKHLGPCAQRMARGSWNDLVVAGVMLRSGYPLIDYSPLLLPACRAFEGFVMQSLGHLKYPSVSHLSFNTENSGVVDAAESVEKSHPGFKRWYFGDLGRMMKRNRNMFMHAGGENNALKDLASVERKYREILDAVLAIDHQVSKWGEKA